MSEVFIVAYNRQL